MKTTTQRGAVLVVALIMLALVTFIVIAYLSFSQRERTSINMSVIQAETRLVLETGTARAQALAADQVSMNANYQLMVSQAGPAEAPVFFDEDKDGRLDPVGRHFLNLNRDLDARGNAVFQPTALSQVGDPQWVGVLEDPGAPHGPDNRFIGRFAFMIVPASKTLDVNYVYNNAKNPGHLKNAIGDSGYARGSGSSRQHLNLAAALGAIHPVWDFRYEQDWTRPSGGLAFRDAGKIFRHAQTVNALFDPGDFLSPLVINSTPDATYKDFNDRLQLAGGAAFYELAGALSIQAHREPLRKLNLNHFKNPRAPITINNAGQILCPRPHGLTNGARVTLYGDTALMPAVLVPNAPNGRLLSVYDDVFVRFAGTQGANDLVALHWDYNGTATGAAQFGVPVSFGRDSRGNLRVADAAFWFPRTRYARNDLAYGIRKNGQQALFVAVRDHESAGVFESDRDQGLWTEALGGVQSAMSTGAFYLDRRRAMFENVAAALLRRGIANGQSFVQTTDRNDMVSFAIPLDQAGYTPEVQRLLQLAANICDVYSPGQFPSVFRPLLEPGNNATLIRRFAHEPHRSFLAQQPRFDLPEDQAKFAQDNQMEMQRRQASPDLPPYFPRVGSIEVDGSRAAVPLLIGAKQAWPSAKGRQRVLSPAINEVVAHTSMQYDNTGQQISPWLRIAVETKRFDDSTDALTLDVKVRNEGNLTYQYHHGTPLAQSRYDRRSYTFSTNSQHTVPSGFSVASIDGPLRSTLPVQAPIVFTTRPAEGRAFERWPWEIAATMNRVECELSTAEDPKDGKRALLVDHADLQPRHLVYAEEIPDWTSPWGYKTGDEVIRVHNDSRYTDTGGTFLTTNRYVARVDHRSDPKDFDFRKPGFHEGRPADLETMDPKLWKSEIWEPKEMYRKGEVYKVTSGIGPARKHEYVIAERDHFAATVPPNGTTADALKRDLNAGNISAFAGELREIAWQANDPLMNSRESDLTHYYNNAITTNNWRNIRYSSKASTASLGLGRSLGSQNFCYQPWSRSANPPESFTLKDAGVESESNWEFPSGGLGNIGELGLLHRGTPWQSLNLKALDPALTPEQWRNWVAPGTSFATPAAPPGTLTWDQMFPNADWPLTEVFAVTDKMDDLRGLLSVNQASRPAWAAALAGVALTHDNTRSVAPNDGKLGEVVTGINVYRDKPDRYKPYPDKTPGAEPFREVWEILAAPELTVASPYAPTGAAATDWDYEAIPRQTLSLLRVESDHRFIAYVFSQALRPAQGSVRPGQTPSNYQVVGEGASRCIFRVDPDPSPRMAGKPHPVSVAVENWTPITVR